MPESQSRVTGGLTNDPAGIAGFEPLEICKASVYDGLARLIGLDLVLGPQKHGPAFFCSSPTKLNVGNCGDEPSQCKQIIKGRWLVPRLLLA
jgi:hypothetical protein